MKIKALFKGINRREYAPFGKSWKFHNRFETVAIFLFLALTVLLCSLCAIFGEPIAYFCLLLPYFLILLFLVYGLRDNIYSLITLGSMTDEEYEALCREYREFKEKNILRYGIITRYAIVTDEGMLPWNKITKIKATPKERYYTSRGVRTIPAKIRYYASVGKFKHLLSLSLSLAEPYDLSDEIERFLDLATKRTDPHCFIDNEYYFEQ